MRFENKLSDNFSDHTGWTPRQRALNSLLTLLNPVLAAENAHNWMKAHGYAAIRPEVDFRKKGMVQ